MTREIPRLSGGGNRFGHLMELRHDPIGLFQRVRRECGELGMFRMLDRDVAFFSGAEAQELFFRQPDEVFDPQPTSNELMRPIFGPGVVYDVPPEKRREMMKSPGAARQEPARLGRGHRARDRAHGEDARRRGRDRSARLHRRAHHLHLERDA